MRNWAESYLNRNSHKIGTMSNAIGQKITGSFSIALLLCLIIIG